MLPARLAEGISVAVLPLMLTVPVTAAPPVTLRVKLVVFRVELVIASEKLADTEEFSAMPVAVFAGDVEDTVGRVVSGAAAVVNCQLKSAPSVLPAASVTAASMVAVYWVLVERATDGVNVAVLPLTFTVPLITAPPEVLTRVKLPLFSVLLVIDSEKVADTEEFVATPVAAFAGDVADTIGGVVSEAAPVVNLQVKFAGNALPAASFAAVVMVAVYCVFAARLTEGTSIAELLLATTCPVIAAPPDVRTRVKLEVLNEELIIASEKVTDIDEFSNMPVAAFDGDVSETVGGVVSESPASTNCSGASSAPPPPQPKRLRLASRITAYMPATTLDPTFLPFDICQALRIESQDHYANDMP